MTTIKNTLIFTPKLIRAYAGRYVHDTYSTMKSVAELYKITPYQLRQAIALGFTEFCMMDDGSVLTDSDGKPCFILSDMICQKVYQKAYQNALRNSGYATNVVEHYEKLYQERSRKRHQFLHPSPPKQIISAPIVATYAEKLQRKESEILFEKQQISYYQNMLDSFEDYSILEDMDSSEELEKSLELSKLRLKKLCQELEELKRPSPLYISV